MRIFDRAKTWWVNASTKARVLAVAGVVCVVVVVLANIF